MEWKRSCFRNTELCSVGLILIFQAKKRNMIHWKRWVWFGLLTGQKLSLIITASYREKKPQEEAFCFCLHLFKQEWRLIKEKRLVHKRGKNIIHIKQAPACQKKRMSVSPKHGSRKAKLKVWRSTAQWRLHTEEQNNRSRRRAAMGHRSG